MSDVPQTPGGFDFSELLKMLQSPEFAEMLQMLQSPGPVNMAIARKTAEETAAVDPDTNEPKSDPPVTSDVGAALDDVVRAVQHSVAEATSISAALTIPARAVDRKAWSEATLTGLEPVLAVLGGALSRGHTQPAAGETPAMTPDALFGMMMPNLVPMLLGWLSGSMIGTLSHLALGQYDLPLPLAGKPEMLFVVQNIDDFAREWSLPRDELRYALALREVVHSAQRVEPWVRERLARLAESYAGAYEVRMDALEEAFGDLDFTNPAAFARFEQLDPGVLLGAMQSERQKPMLEEIQRFVSVLEGYTDVVVSMLGERMVASHAEIDEALKRHRLERGTAAGAVDKLLGLELDRGHYDAGVAFCRGVVERSDGLESLNRIWASEELLPTPAELEAPGLWLARIDLPGQ